MRHPRDTDGLRVVNLILGEELRPVVGDEFTVWQTGYSAFAAWSKLGISEALAVCRFIASRKRESERSER